MAKPEKPLPLPLSVFKVESITPTLEKDGKIYARLITVKDKNGKVFNIRERTGIEVENYHDKPLESVVEIVKAKFYDPKAPKFPDGIIKGTFEGWNTGYKFFPELVSMVDGETGDADDADFDEDEYDVLATELFEKWGIKGFGLDVYRDKPMVKTENDTFFLNEFIFEEQIDKWEDSLEPHVPVCFVIEELLLHGIKPYEGKWEPTKPKQQEFVAGPNEAYVTRGKFRILK